MLSELSMARMVTSPERDTASSVRGRYGCAKRHRQQREQQRAQREQNQIAQAAMLDGALRAPLEKHQRAEGTGVALCLRNKCSQTAGPRRPDRPGTRERESPFRASPAHAQILAQAFIELACWYPPGSSPCPRRAPGSAAPQSCASILVRYSWRAYSGETSIAEPEFSISTSSTARGIWARFLRIQQMKQDHLIARSAAAQPF